MDGVQYLEQFQVSTVVGCTMTASGDIFEVKFTNIDEAAAHLNLYNITVYQYAYVK